MDKVWESAKLQIVEMVTVRDQCSVVPLYILVMKEWLVRYWLYVCNECSHAFTEHTCVIIFVNHTLQIAVRLICSASVYCNSIFIVYVNR